MEVSKDFAPKRLNYLVLLNMGSRQKNIDHPSAAVQTRESVWSILFDLCTSISDYKHIILQAGVP
jgi:hypothetical protein